MRTLETALRKLRIPGLGRWLLVLAGVAAGFVAICYAAFFLLHDVPGHPFPIQPPAWSLALGILSIGLGALLSLLRWPKALVAIVMTALPATLFAAFFSEGIGGGLSFGGAGGIALGVTAGAFGMIGALLFSGEEARTWRILVPPQISECNVEGLHERLRRVQGDRLPQVAASWTALAAALLLRRLLGRMAFYRFLRSYRVRLPEAALLALMPRPAEAHLPAHGETYLQSTKILGIPDPGMRLFTLAVRLAVKGALLDDRSLVHLENLGKKLRLDGTWRRAQIEILYEARHMDLRTAAQLLGVPEDAKPKQIEAAFQQGTAAADQAHDVLLAARIRLLARKDPGEQETAGARL